MSKNLVTNQERINEAVQAIFHHFDAVLSFSGHYRCMSKAQQDIMVMATHYHRLLALHEDELDDTNNEDITEFFWLAQEVFDLLKPFAELVEQGSDKESLS